MIPVRSLAVVLAAGGLAVLTGPAALPRADAQAPPAAPLPPTVPPAPAASPVPPLTWSYTYATPNRPTWEYEFADVPKELPAFKTLLADKAKAGWEYAGNATGTDTRSKPSAGTKGDVQLTAEVTVAVFKRPGKPAAVTATFGAPAPATPAPPVAPAFMGFGAARPTPPAVDPAAEVERAKAALEQAKANLERARAAAEAAEARAKAAGPVLVNRAIAVKNVSAQDVADAIGEVFNVPGRLDNIRATADARTNTVYLEGPAEVVKQATAVIRILTEATKDGKKDAGKKAD